MQPRLANCHGWWEHKEGERQVAWLTNPPYAMDQVAFCKPSPVQKEAQIIIVNNHWLARKGKTKDLPCSLIIRCERPLRKRERKWERKNTTEKQKDKYTYTRILIDRYTDQLLMQSNTSWYWRSHTSDELSMNITLCTHIHSIASHVRQESLCHS